LRRRRRKHQLRHAHALGLARESVPLKIIQRQLVHTRSRARTSPVRVADAALASEHASQSVYFVVGCAEFVL
jgi:integrase